MFSGAVEPLMSKWLLVACLVLAAFPIAGCNVALGALGAEPAPPPPAFTVFRRQALFNGHGIALSVLGPALERSDIERIAANERRSLVRVLVYTPDQTVGKDQPTALWEHIDGRGLKQIY
jgi:hypothetical protein